MNGTFYSTGGSQAASPDGARAKIRLAALVAVTLFGSALMVWVTRSTWQRMNRLQHEFETLRAESFYIGVRMRGRIQQLNDTLLRYRLRGDASDYEGFRNGANELRQWFESSRTNATTSLEHAFFEQMGTAYNEYLVESTEVLEANRARWQSTQAKEFRDSYEQVQSQSKHLLESCETFILGQREAFDGFLEESRAALSAFQRLLKLSLALLLALIVFLAVLVYRGMIAPLRHQLTESQAIIARQEKLASLGSLAAGVAHEIRNPLTAIKFRLFSLKKSLPESVDNEDATVIGNEINRLERIVKEFLEFARPAEPALVEIPAQRILQDAYELLKPSLEKAEVRLKLELTNLGSVRADLQQIEQVLINLVQNAADSTGRGGVVTLRARNESSSARKKSVNAVVLEVVDTGPGIPPEVQKRLFDPFFTTKEGGTGLGLSIAARIVEMHGGEIRYHTQLNRGTTFTIVLPRVSDHESPNPAD